MAERPGARRGREEEENAAELKLGKDFGDARCLMNSEVAIILNHKMENSDDEQFTMSSVFGKSLAYVTRFAAYKNSETVSQVRQILESKGLHHFEIGTIGNLVPATAEEAKALVPSLKDQALHPDLDDEEIQAMLDDMSRVQQFQ
eukprot:jgi/Mesvir1/4724/Mv11592-RA.1